MKAIWGSLQRKLLLLLGLLIVPLNILSIYMASLTIRDAQQSILSSIQSTISTYTDKIDQALYNTDFLLYTLAEENTDGVRLMSLENGLDYQVAKLAVGSWLKQYRINIETADVFYFYRTDLDDLTLNSDDTWLFRNYLEEHNYFTDAETRQSSWHLEQLEDEWYLVRSLFTGNTSYGALVNLTSKVSDISDYLEYPVYEISFSDTAPEASASAGQCSVPCEQASLWLTLSFGKNVLTRNVSVWRWLMIGILVLYVFLCPILYFYIRKWVITPLRTLNQAHYQLECGNEGFRISGKAGSQELDEAFSSFNQMAGSLQTLRLEKINRELAYKQMLLDNLQLQIRPHFLLNSFNLLYTMVTTGKQKASQQMILYLSQYFRYLFQYNRDLEIFQKEFDLIQKYLEVSRYQYSDSFTFQYEFDPEISFVRVPPLLLHNFVDNILQHALIPGKTVHIVFSGFYEDQLVTFRLADDGTGISPEEVAQINSGNFEDYKRGRHVGLRNSIKRLKFFYHDEGTVHVESEIGEGTVFTITFPYNLDEDEPETENGLTVTESDRTTPAPCPPQDQPAADKKISPGKGGQSHPNC